MAVVAAFAFLLAAFRDSPLLRFFLAGWFGLTAARTLATFRRREAEGAQLSLLQRAAVVDSSAAVALLILIPSVALWIVVGFLSVIVLSGLFPEPFLPPHSLYLFALPIATLSALALARHLARRLWPCLIGERVVIAWLSGVESPGAPPGVEGDAARFAEGLDGFTEAAGIVWVTGGGLEAGDAPEPEGVEGVHPEFSDRLADDRGQRHEAVAGVGPGQEAQLQPFSAATEGVTAQLRSLDTPLDPGVGEGIGEGRVVVMAPTVLVAQDAGGHAFRREVPDGPQERCEGFKMDAGF
jgi:hypothetical protein